MSKMKQVMLLGLFGVLSACSTVTITPQGRGAFNAPPTFEQRQNFYWWGLSPSARSVDVADICNGLTPVQLQTEDTFVDSLFAVLTLGIYRPRTARVWCD